MFPHLAPDATWTQRNDAGQRLRVLYETGNKERQISITGHAWTGDVRVYSSTFDHEWVAFTMGCPYAFSMANGMIVHRAMARAGGRNGANRRHHITNALRIRDALCWGGLCPKYRARVLAARALQEVPA